MPALTAQGASSPSVEEHGACILAIVGSRDVNAAGAKIAIEAAIDRHKPIVLVSGGAKASGANRLRKLVSVDEQVAIRAKELGIQMVEFIPKTYQFNGPGGFKERNMQIADLCHCLVRVASSTSTTYGSGWTADYAEREGKNVERYIVDEQGRITEGNHTPPERSF